MKPLLLRSIKQAFCLLLMSALLAASPASHTSPMDEVDHEQIAIWSEGVRLAGDIYKPKGMQAGEKLPGLLLVHGWGGGKQHLNRAYAPQFASLGGGVALVTAARDNRIRAYVDQVGAVNFRANLHMITDEMVTRWEIQRARGDIASYPGGESVINPALKGYPDWIYLKRFDSFASAEHLKVPTLIIDAEDEDLFAREVNGALLHDTIRNRVDSKYVVIPGKHHDIYRGESYEKALAEARDWFVKHLKGRTEGAALHRQ